MLRRKKTRRISPEKASLVDRPFGQSGRAPRRPKGTPRPPVSSHPRKSERTSITPSRVVRLVHVADAHIVTRSLHARDSHRVKSRTSERPIVNRQWPRCPPPSPNWRCTPDRADPRSRDVTRSRRP